MTASTPTAARSLDGILASVFGFASFRANQREVCEAVIAGRDVLLVMPTGSGKSLCYQLPALARGGTALVISPLIALMEDQTARLARLGLKVGRVHSSLDRDAARAACRRYLNGDLQFLFIAPERLRVPGFGAMLAKRRPSLIAIDEAHCISQWGHDFRPDYRMLSLHLGALRPAPVIALTATATPVVQNDIVEQLGMKRAARFIHGFRREDLAIESVEVSRPHRAEFARDLLTLPGRRPAIVYAPTRKETEATAAELSAAFPCAAYHAGLDAETREHVQRGFLAGEYEVIVATVAFGMGIDKPDVRTVIHTALPSSLESYYQEIGRAGRDGAPSRAILMHSWADRRMHDYFHQRDYPDLSILDAIYGKLSDRPRVAEKICFKLDMDPEVFRRALQKIAAHGGARIDYDGTVTALGDGWRASYAMQSRLHQEQIEKVLRYAEGSRCRMAALVEHFGDTEDARQNCGLCDICAPRQAIAEHYRPLTRREAQITGQIVEALRPLAHSSTGRLHKQLYPDERVTRDEFEALLSALARGGYAVLEDAEFERDGRVIAYRRARLTGAGQAAVADMDLTLPDSFPGAEARPAPSRSRSPRAGGPAKTNGKSAVSRNGEAALTSDEVELEQRLKEWRREEATRNGFPAYRVFGDKTLRAIVMERPQTIEDLLRIDGVGAKKAARFGEQICALCAEA